MKKKKGGGRGNVSSTKMASGKEVCRGGPGESGRRERLGREAQWVGTSFRGKSPPRTSCEARGEIGSAKDGASGDGIRQWQHLHESRKALDSEKGATRDTFLSWESW